jgi:tetratricopeptide (TPR) repeat protein
MINTSVIENKSDEVLISADTVIHNDSEIYNIVSKLASQIRASLEIKSAEEEVDEQWLKGFTTNSVEAYREFVFGHERFVHTDWLSARRHYRNAIAKDSSFALAYVWLATVYQMLNDYHGTQYCYQKASQLRHKLSFKEQLFVDILRTELEENYSQQIYLTTEIVDRWDPESNFWQFILGRAYLKNRQYQKAVEALEGQYLRGWPFVYTYYFLAESYASLDQFGESLKVFEAGLNQHRTFTAFYAWMSAIYYKLKDHSNYEYYKEQFFKTTSVQLTTAPEQYLEAGNGYRHRQLYSDAIECYSKGLLIDPDYYEPYYWLGIIYTEEKQYTKAADNFKRFLTYQAEGKKADEAQKRLRIIGNSNLD